MPPYILLTPASSAASKGVEKLRYTPGRKSEPVVKGRSSVPKKSGSTVAPAPLKVLWPEVYSGNGGVTSKGIQFSSGSAKAIAVTGRQKSKVYFASHAQIAASAMAMFKRANNLAFSSSVLPCPAPIICAMLFQCPGGVSVPVPSAQNKAISVWSSVRVELTSSPSSLTSLKSAAYCWLSRDGGPGGRNCELLVIANGTTNPHCGSKYGRNNGGVGTHTPGPLPPGGWTIALNPSFARAARIWVATNSPHVMPFAFCGPFGIPARIAA